MRVVAYSAYSHRCGIWVLIAALLLCAPVTAAQAEEIDAAKQAGQVGEQIDGYLGLVRPVVPAPVKALVDETNAKRRVAYQQIGAKNGATADTVARLAGVKLVERTPAGEYVRDDTGKWKRK